jgi:hypothetical protein
MWHVCLPNLHLRPNRCNQQTVGSECVRSNLVRSRCDNEILAIDLVMHERDHSQHNGT